MLKNAYTVEIKGIDLGLLTKNVVKTMSVMKLYFKETVFVEEKKLQIRGSEIAVLEIDTEKKEAILTYKPECSLVDKKIAERQAQGICKGGFLLESGERIGIGCKVIIVG